MRGLAFFSFGFLSVLIALYIYWRFIWIFRNPLRKIPSGDHIVSPADGTVIHAKRLDPDEKAISVDRNVQLSINDIVGEDLRRPVILIGICMSPFDVQYIRSPLTGTIELIRHPPPALRNFRMGSMCWKILMRRSPFHRNSIRILQNERKVITGRFAENPL
jgi:phosphatidylserine decarboxylase